MLFLGISLLFIFFGKYIPTINEKENQKIKEREAISDTLRADTKVSLKSFDVEKKQYAPLIDVFDDFFCEYCKENFFQTILPLKESPLLQEKNIRIIFHTFIKENDSSLPLKKAVLCAKEQEKEWELREKIFASDKKNAHVARVLFAEIGGNMPAFDHCLSSEITTFQIEEDIKYIQEHNITVVPTILFQEKRFEGVVPKENIEHSIR